VTSYRIPNSYQTPIGSALGNLMTAFASMPSPEDRAFKQAQLQNVQSQAALNQQKIADSQREAQYGGKITDVFRKAFTPVEDARPNAEFVGPIPEVAPDERVRRALPDLAGTLPPAQIGQLGETMMAMFANAPGTSQGAVERSQIGAGKPYASTQTAVDAERERKYQSDMDRNMRAENAAQYAADRQARGIEAAASKTPYKVLGPGGVPVYAFGRENLEGRQAPFDQQSGPLVSDAVKAQTQISELDSLEKLGNAFLAEAKANPHALGAAGWLNRAVSGGTEQAKAFGDQFGVDTTTGIKAVQDYMAAKGVSVADPGVASKLDVYAALIPYKGASALAQQQGRSATNEDVKRFQALFGTGAIANYADLEARWGIVQKIINDERARAQPRLRPGMGGAVTNTFSPQPAAPAAAPGMAPVRRRYNPATGKIE